MTKRERETLIRKLDRIESKVARKRDELRKLVTDYGALIESVNSGADDMDTAISHLHDARDALDTAADTLSQYV